jgi:peptidoglycan/LPS O-acetylase OafA/YrhL
VVRHGGVGVSIFFVISGFVIAHSVGRARITAGYLGNFALRRSIRLDPPYWFAIAIVMGTELLKTRLLPGYRPDLPSLRSLAAHAIYTFGILGVPPILPIFWTLCHEVQFYLLYCLILGATRRGATPSGNWPATPFAVTGAISATGVFNVRGLCVETWYMFALGVLLYYAYTSRPSRKVFLLYLLFLSAALAWTCHPYRITAVATALVVGSAAATGNLARWLSGRIFQHLGRISYSLYLIHGVLGWQVLSVGGDLIGVTSPLGALAWLALAVAVSLLTAQLMHTAIERPSLQLARRLKSEATALAPMGGGLAYGDGPRAPRVAHQPMRVSDRLEP